VSGCSQPAGSAARWCAFTLPGSMPIGSTELWVIDVNAAIAGDVPCDGSHPGCRKLTGMLWTGAPRDSSGHPFVHHFEGETLIYYVGPSTDQPFLGTIFAWRPGWPEGKALTGPNGYSCSGHPTADVALCIEETQLGATPPYLDMHAGRVNGNRLPLASRVYPSTSTNAAQWNATFTEAGDYFAYSTGGPAPTDKETIYAWKIDEVGMMDKRITLGTGLSRWNISADGKRWYYLRDFNYPPRRSGIDPSGTLVTADFPAGGNPVTIAPRVGSYVTLAQDGADRGVAYLDQLAMGRGNYKILRDLTSPATATTVATSVLSASISPDLRFSILETQYDPMNGTVDAVVIKNDGTGRCTLVATPTTDVFGADFLPGAGRVFWADNIDNNRTGAGEGWMANPDGCGEKQKFGDLVDLWFVSGDRGLLYSDGATPATATLRFAKLGANGQFPEGGGTVIREGISRVYAPLGRDRDHVVFQIASGGPDDGLYVYGPIGFGK
jgi:hypothetical protein